MEQRRRHGKKTYRRKNLGKDKYILRLIAAVLNLICAFLFVVLAAMIVFRYFYKPEESWLFGGGNARTETVRELEENGDKGGLSDAEGTEGAGSRGNGASYGTAAEGAVSGRTSNGAGKSGENGADGFFGTDGLFGLGNGQAGGAGDSGGMLSEKDTDEAGNRQKRLSDAAFLFGGNIYLSDYVTEAYDAAGGISGVLSEDIRKLISGADVFMANQVFPLSSRGTPQADKAYTYRVDPARGELLAEMGLHVVSLANNHTLDYGADAFSDTLDILDGLGLAHTGAGRNKAEAGKAFVTDIGGMRTAFFSASRRVPDPGWGAGDKTPGIYLAYDAWLSDYLETIRTLDAQNDFVVVYLHWGSEDESSMEDSGETRSGQAAADRMEAVGSDAGALEKTVTGRRAEPARQNEAAAKTGAADIAGGKSTAEAARKYMQTLARQTVSAGADLVVGADTYALSGVEYYQGVPIVYSLGNFVYGSRIPESMLLSAELSGETGALRLRLYPAEAALGFTYLPSDDAQTRAFFRKLDALSVNARIDENGLVKEKGQ